LAGELRFHDTVEFGEYLAVLFKQAGEKSEASTAKSTQLGLWVGLNLDGRTEVVANVFGCHGIKGGHGGVVSIGSLSSARVYYS